MPNIRQEIVMSRFNPVPRLVLFGAVALLAACGGDKGATTSATTSAASESTPHGAILQATRLMQKGDFVALWNASVPPVHQEALKQEFMKEFRGEEITDEKREEFAQMMQRLTGPNAEAEMMAELRPQLEQLQSEEMKAQLPAMVAFGRGMALQAIAESEEFTPTQKQQATGVVNALATWVEKGDFADPARAERAIAAITRTARNLPVKTLDELHALDFEGLLGVVSSVYSGAKDVTRAYDIDIDQMLASVQAETISQDGDNANVRVKMQFLGQPLEFETPMVRVDGRWYGKDTIDKVTKVGSTAAAE
jgi:hypothetical protein